MNMGSLSREKYEKIGNLSKNLHFLGHLFMAYGNACLLVKKLTKGRILVGKMR
jgi:hypothetical protein